MYLLPQENYTLLSWLHASCGELCKHLCTPANLHNYVIVVSLSAYLVKFETLRFGATLTWRSSAWMMWEPQLNHVYVCLVLKHTNNPITNVFIKNRASYKQVETSTSNELSLGIW